MEPTSTAAGSPGSSRTLITTLVVVAALACVILLAWMLGRAQVDPYVQSTLSLNGVTDHGGQLFDQLRDAMESPARVCWARRYGGRRMSDPALITRS